jgi:ABC-type branched-subunit amino acid transport system substrate-binding protein
MRIPRVIALVSCVSLLLAASACTKSVEEPSAPYEGAYLYGSDGNMTNGLGNVFKELPALLEGMKGTTPGVKLPSDFTDRLRVQDPTLQDYLYAAETYDAVIIVGLAAQLAGTTDASVIAKHVNGVTTGGTPCKTAAACLALAKSGADLAYRGISLPNGFTSVGEPATASYATLHFDASNQLDAGKTEFVGTGNDANVSKDPVPAPVVSAKKAKDAPLTLGGLLPNTGGLAFTVKPMLAGAALGVKELNAAGGVLGAGVVWYDGDDGTSVAVARKTISEHKMRGVDVLIGTGASGVALGVLQDAIKANMIMFSPSNTAAKLSGADDSGYYFRTAPSDILQARALADIMMRDSNRKIVLIAHDTDYGTGLQSDVRKELIAAGIAPEAIMSFNYKVTPDVAIADPAELAEIAKKALGFKPDGVLVIGYEESSEAIKALHTAGLAFRR